MGDRSREVASSSAFPEHAGITASRKHQTAAVFTNAGCLLSRLGVHVHSTLEAVAETSPPSFGYWSAIQGGRNGSPWRATTGHIRESRRTYTVIGKRPVSGSIWSTSNAW